MADPLHNEFPPGSIEAKDLEHLLHPTTNLAQHQLNGPKVLSRAEGVYVWDNQGKQYIEAMAGLWCTALGYGEEELVRVAAEQMRELSYNQLFGGKTNEASVLLAEKLKSMATKLSEATIRKKLMLMKRPPISTGDTAEFRAAVRNGSVRAPIIRGPSCERTWAFSSSLPSVSVGTRKAV